MFNLGAINNLKCPVCGCDNHMVCEARDEYINNEGILSVRSDLNCEECDSSFEQYSTFDLIPRDETALMVSWAQHNSNFGEGKFA